MAPGEVVMAPRCTVCGRPQGDLEDWNDAVTDSEERKCYGTGEAVCLAVAAVRREYVEAMRKVEWVRHENMQDTPDHICPWCCEDSADGHAPGCLFARLAGWGPPTHLVQTVMRPPASELHAAAMSTVDGATAQWLTWLGKQLEDGWEIRLVSPLPREGYVRMKPPRDFR